MQRHADEIKLAGHRAVCRVEGIADIRGETNRAIAGESFAVLPPIEIPSAFALARGNHQTFVAMGSTAGKLATAVKSAALVRELFNAFVSVP